MSIDTDEFVKKAHRILDRFERSLLTLQHAKDEARALLMQFEEEIRKLEE